MSYKKYLDDLIIDDGYGSLSARKADYFWNTKQRAVVKNWEPKVNFPQVEEIIAALSGSGTPIAGGSILGCLEALEFGDIDIFPLTEEQLKLTVRALEILGYKENKGDLKYSRSFSHSSSVYRPVQIILIHMGRINSLSQVLESFDLSCVQVGVADNHLHTFKHALEDIDNRRLRVCGTLNVKSLLLRIIKYRNRGFHFYEEEFEKDGIDPLEQIFNNA